MGYTHVMDTVVATPIYVHHALAIRAEVKAMLCCSISAVTSKMR